MAKCLEMLRTADKYHLVIQNPVACISYIYGGEHPPNFNVMEMTGYEACKYQHGRDTKPQKQHL